MNGTRLVEVAALFSVIGKDAELHNITIENANFTNGNYAAGFAVFHRRGKAAAGAVRQR